MANLHESPINVDDNLNEMLGHIHTHNIALKEPLFQAKTLIFLTKI